jgi:CheY-like chemotaxis protein
MLILLIEDDPVQAALMEKAIRERLGAETFRIATESDFLARLDEIARRAPGAIVIDVMLRWADPAEQMPPTPVDYKKMGGYRRAGLRCQKKLMEGPRTRAIPAILYTVLPRESLHLGGTDLAYVQKGDGFDELLQRLQPHAARR